MSDVEVAGGTLVELTDTGWEPPTGEPGLAVEETGADFEGVTLTVLDEGTGTDILVLIL